MRARAGPTGMKTIRAVTSGAASNLATRSKRVRPVVFANNVTNIIRPSKSVRLGGGGGPSRISRNNANVGITALYIIHAASESYPTRAGKWGDKGGNGGEIGREGGAIMYGAVSADKTIYGCNSHMDRNADGRCA